MSQFYTDLSRKEIPFALPDAETFYNTGTLCDEGGDPLPHGWYWWSCFPGCLPDGEPNGPFKSEHDAIVDARQ